MFLVRLVSKPAVFAVRLMCTPTGCGTSIFVANAERMKLLWDGRSHRRRYRPGLAARVLLYLTQAGGRISKRLR